MAMSPKFATRHVVIVLYFSSVRAEFNHRLRTKSHPKVASRRDLNWRQRCKYEHPLEKKQLQYYDSEEPPLQNLSDSFGRLHLTACRWPGPALTPRSRVRGGGVLTVFKIGLTMTVF